MYSILEGKDGKKTSNEKSEEVELLGKDKRILKQNKKI